MSSTSELLERYGPDELTDGTVVVFTKTFVEDGPEYTYAAVRGYGQWYCTNGEKYDWLRLSEEAERDNVSGSGIYELDSVVPVWETE